MFKWIDHAVIAVNSLDEAIPVYTDKLGLKLERRGEMPSQGIKQAIFPLGGEGRFLELVEPMGPETPVGRALSRRGEGMYLLALAVDDMGKAIQELQSKGVQLIGADQGPGAQVFIHPRSAHGVLIQLVERKE